jgi:hypothetical protein
MIRRWERFWFEEVPPEGFALVRIAVGAAGLVSLLGFVPVALFWMPDGIVPVPEPGGLRSSLLELGLGPWAGWLVFLTLLASFACMTAGLFSGAAIVVCFLGSVFQMRWNALPLTSGHTVLVAVLFCLVWADCGARLSVDAWRRGRGGRGSIDALQPIWPLRLIRAQVAVVYFTSGVFKLLGPAWRSGSAVHYTTGQNLYGRIFHVFALPATVDWTLTVLTYATLFWELSFPFLLLHRHTRRIALGAGIAIHAGIWATMEVGPFTWMMLAAYVAFLDPHRLRDIASRSSRFTGSVSSTTESSAAADLMAERRSSAEF